VVLSEDLAADESRSLNARTAAAVYACSIRLFAPAITGWKTAPSRDLLKRVAGQIR